MIDIENIKQYEIERPNTWTIFGDPEDFDKMPIEHKDQIIFLGKEADKYLDKFMNAAKLVDVNDDPFRKNNFKNVSKYYITEDEQALKKWLYNLEIPFKTNVFLCEDSFIYTTWKMVVKYSPNIFFRNDVIVFDKTLNWCLFYFHHDVLFFGRGNIYDSKQDESHMEMINKLKQQYPQFNFPY